MTDKPTPDTAAKHMTEAAKRLGVEGTHPATQAALRRPRIAAEARAAQFARVERGHTA